MCESYRPFILSFLAGIYYPLVRFNVAIAKPPFTVEKLKSILDFLKYYDLADKGCYSCIAKYSDLADFYKMLIERNKKRRENVLRIFDYCATDFDRDLLRRRYVYNEDFYTIAYELAYCDRSIYKKLKKALERLSENTKNVQEFEY